MSKTKQDPIRESDLVVLQYAFNPLFVRLVEVGEDVKEKGFFIDLERRVWSSDIWKNVPIGRERAQVDYYLGASKYHYHTRGCVKDGVIGVYDKRDTKQLVSMVSSATRAEREASREHDHYDEL